MRSEFLQDVKKLTSLLAGNHEDLPMSIDEWDAILEIASQQLLAGSLGHVVNSLPPSLQPLDEQFIAYTNEIFELQKSREIDLKQSIVVINRLLKEVQPVWLKGGDDLLQGLTVPGNRWMTDLDPMVRESEIKPAWMRCLDNGYEIFDQQELESFNWGYDGWHQVPSIFHEDQQIVIEIHRYVGRKETRQILPEKECIERSIFVEDFEGQPCRVLQPTDGFIHRLIHAQKLDWDNEKNKSIPVRHFYHLYLYVIKHQNDIDWSEVQTRCDKFGYDKVLKQVTYLLGFLFNQKLPFYDEYCQEGETFFNRVQKKYSNPKRSGFWLNIKIFFTLIYSAFNKESVILSFRKIPETKLEWFKAYLYRFFSLFTKVFSFSSWKKWFNYLKSKEL